MRIGEGTPGFEKYWEQQTELVVDVRRNILAVLH